MNLPFRPARRRGRESQSAFYAPPLSTDMSIKPRSSIVTAIRAKMYKPFVD
jgi:hypothetical protein